MKRQHACREHRAFTLVELLVVVAIISILVGLLLPAISGAKASANKTVCLSNIKQVDTLLFMAISDENPRRFPNKGTINKLFQLHPGFTNSSKETKILECPSDRGLTAGGTCFVDSPTDPQSRQAKRHENHQQEQWMIHLDSIQHHGESNRLLRKVLCRPCLGPIAPKFWDHCERYLCLNL